MNEFVALPAILFLPWFVSLLLFTRWKRYAEPGDPMSWPARAGVAGLIGCLAVVAIMAVRVLGPAEWFVLMIVGWVGLTWLLYRTLLGN